MRLDLLLAVLAGVSPQAPPDSAVYVLSAASRLEVKTGKAGLFGFAGHDHVIRARAFTGRIVLTDSVARVEVVVPTDSLEVLTPPDSDEIRKVTATMRTEVLDVAQYPEIRFVSQLAKPPLSHVPVTGSLTIKGVTRAVSFDLSVARLDQDTIRAALSFLVNQTDFGIKPYRGGPGGTVRVADKVVFTVAFVAVRR